MKIWERKLLSLNAVHYSTSKLSHKEDCSKDNLVLRVYHLQGGGKMTDTGNEVAPKNGAAWHRFTWSYFCNR